MSMEVTSEERLFAMVATIFTADQDSKSVRIKSVAIVILPKTRLSVV